ncbi:hypothetical protein NDU88_009015 [Pleurodeles waltl]|uniref:Uncharacterized protein n=1 Tax=Pleurodeles waltl TaxID=8319 RepID=A0AAV7QTG6_PLEWA|nr:hypothetical protein NDU88_009015 [Pleurodeles waltl]
MMPVERKVQQALLLLREPCHMDLVRASALAGLPSARRAVSMWLRPFWLFHHRARSMCAQDASSPVGQDLGKPSTARCRSGPRLRIYLDFSGGVSFSQMGSAASKSKQLRKGLGIGSRAVLSALGRERRDKMAGTIIVVR